MNRSFTESSSIGLSGGLEDHDTIPADPPQAISILWDRPRAGGVIGSAGEGRESANGAGTPPRSGSLTEHCGNAHDRQQEANRLDNVSNRRNGVAKAQSCAKTDASASRPCKHEEDCRRHDETDEHQHSSDNHEPESSADWPSRLLRREGNGLLCLPLPRDIHRLDPSAWQGTPGW